MTCTACAACRRGKTWRCSAQAPTIWDFDKIMMLGEFMRRVRSPAPLRMPATAKNIADAIRPYASLMQEELWIVTCDSVRPTRALQLSPYLRGRALT